MLERLLSPRVKKKLLQRVTVLSAEKWVYAEWLEPCFGPQKNRRFIR